MEETELINERYFVKDKISHRLLITILLMTIIITVGIMGLCSVFGFTTNFVINEAKLLSNETKKFSSEFKHKIAKFDKFINELEPIFKNKQQLIEFIANVKYLVTEACKLPMMDCPN